MIDWYTLLVPIAVSGVLALFRFVGCRFSEPIINEPYNEDVLRDNPFVYYQMDESSGSTTAADTQGRLNGQYGVADGVHTLPLLSGSDAATYRSLPIAAPSILVGAPSVVPRLPDKTSVRFNGAFLSANGSLGDLSRFSVDLLVRPEWDIANERNFYSVVDYSNFVPGLGASGPNRNAGFAIYAGPDDPSNPASPITWQLWIGTGNGFERAFPIVGIGGPRVSAENTYLAIEFGSRVFLHAYTLHVNIDDAEVELVRSAYVPATDPDPTRLPLRVGISGAFAGLIPPFPSPQAFIYPFVGRIAEVAIYNTDLEQGRVISHIVNAFNTT
jgi:hypothetical protein